MKKVLLYSMLLILGLAASQLRPDWDLDLYDGTAHFLTIAFIMIHVGYEFEIDRAAPPPVGDRLRVTHHSLQIRVQRIVDEERPLVSPVQGSRSTARDAEYEWVSSKPAGLLTTDWLDSTLRACGIRLPYAPV